MWHLVHNQGIVRDDYIVIKMESKWLLCYIHKWLFCKCWVVTIKCTLQNRQLYILKCDPVFQCWGSPLVIKV